MLVRMQLDQDKMKLIAVFFETYLQLNPEEEMELKKDLEKLDVHEAKRKRIEQTSKWLMWRDVLVLETGCLI